MRTYFFGTFSKKRAAALDRIAKRYQSDGAFIAANLPEGPRYWFVIPNFGVPFNPPHCRRDPGGCKSRRVGVAQKVPTVAGAVAPRLSPSDTL